MIEVENTKKRYLVLHDYGMGGLWWWVWAESPQEIVREVAEIEVVTAPEAVLGAETWSLEEVDLSGQDPNPLSILRAKRDAQRGQPGFGALVGRSIVHLRMPADDEDGVVLFLMEIGWDGRRIRQVEVRPDGSAIRTDAEDWPFNSPFDLHDPQYASMEIGSDAFEASWDRARREPDSQG